PWPDSRPRSRRRSPNCGPTWQSCTRPTNTRNNFSAFVRNCGAKRAPGLILVQLPRSDRNNTALRTALVWSPALPLGVGSATLVELADRRHSAWYNLRSLPRFGLRPGVAATYQPRLDLSGCPQTRRPASLNGGNGMLASESTCWTVIRAAAA